MTMLYTNRYYNIRSYTSIALVSEPFHLVQRMPGLTPEVVIGCDLLQFFHQCVSRRCRSQSLTNHDQPIEGRAHLMTDSSF